LSNKDDNIEDDVSSDKGDNKVDQENINKEINKEENNSTESESLDDKEPDKIAEKFDENIEEPDTVQRILFINFFENVCIHCGCLDVSKSANEYPHCNDCESNLANSKNFSRQSKDIKNN
ncbi:10530_t:CDS:2, partial [Racocetra persica]